MDDARDVFVRRYRDEGWWRPELLTDHVRAWAAKLPYVTAVVDGPLRLTWAQLWDSARRTAAQLARLGVGAGDVVSTQLPNGVEIIVSHLAAELVGAVHNPVALQFRTHELDQIHSLLEPKLMVYPATAQRDDFAAIHAETTPGRNCRVESVGVLFDVDKESEIAGFEQSPMAANEAAFVLNTSGTVSVKGVTHSHEDALYSTRTVGIDIVGLSPEDTVLCIIPMTWGGGLAWGLRVALHAGATLISVPRWDARAAAEIIDAERCSYVYGPPTVARDLVALSGEWRPQRPLTMICAGAPIPRYLCRDAKSLLSMRLLPGYGQTEHLHSTLGRPADTEAQLTTTDGRPLPGVELKTVDEAGDPSEGGGEIWCRGPNVAMGYFGQPGFSAQTFRADGWQTTQDLGRLDADGFLSVSGRKRDIIIRGGLNVSPREVEELLQRHPDVAEAAVIGVQDARYGERICAFIVPRTASAPTTAELSAALTAFGVAQFKHPEEVRTIDALPLTATGKVRHESLREMLRAETAQ
jgi:acyl-CoA synthetase (AMP-forming)/AMP-acid ligase II